MFKKIIAIISLLFLILILLQMFWTTEPTTPEGTWQGDYAVIHIGETMWMDIGQLNARIYTCAMGNIKPALVASQENIRKQYHFSENTIFHLRCTYEQEHYGRRLDNFYFQYNGNTMHLLWPISIHHAQPLYDLNKVK